MFRKKINNNFSKMAIANLDIFIIRLSQEMKATRGKKSECTRGTRRETHHRIRGIQA